MKSFKYIDKRIVCSGLLVTLGGILLYCLLDNAGSVKAFLGSVWGYFSPVTGGLLLAYILRPFAKFIERILPKFIKSPKARLHIGGISALVLMILIIILLLYTVFPQLLTSVTSIVNNMGSYTETIKSTLTDITEKLGIENVDVDKLIGTNDDLIKTAGKWLTDNLNYVLNLFYAFGSQAFNFIIVMAMSIYALLDRHNIKRGLLRLEKVVLGADKSNWLNNTINRADRIMMKFLSSNLLDALIIGAVNFIFLGIAKAPYQLLLSILLGVTNFIPTFGPIIGGIIAGAIILLTKPGLLIIFIIFTLILQQLDGNLIKPILFGDSTGLSPFWVLVAIVVGGRIFGIVGMIIGVPLLALLASIYDEILDAKGKKTGELQNEA